MESIMKVGPKVMEIEKPPTDAVSISRETSKGMGKLKFEPREAYKEEL